MIAHQYLHSFDSNLQRLFFNKMTLGIEQDLTRLKTFCGVYNLHTSIASRFMTSLQVFLGFSSSQIGLILGLMRVGTSIISPAVSSYADTNKAHRTLLLVQSSLRIIPLLLMWLLLYSGSLSIWSFWILNSAVSVLGTGTSPMSDALILAALEDKSQYGRVRLWGALAYGLGNMFIGVCIALYGTFDPMFGLSLMTVFAALAVSYRFLPPYASHVRSAEPINFRSVFEILTRSVSTKIFFVNAVVVGASLSLVESLLFVTMERSMKGSSPVIAGASVLVSVAFELPIFRIAPSLIRKYGTKHMLILANLAWIVRGLGYAVFESAWIVLVLELFHGVTFGLFYSASVHTCVKQSPPGMESTMQSLLDMTFNGLGVALGSIGGGFLFDFVGTSNTFYIFSVVIGLSTLGLIFLLETDHLNDHPLILQELASVQDVS